MLEKQAANSELDRLKAGVLTTSSERDQLQSALANQQQEAQSLLNGKMLLNEELVKTSERFNLVAGDLVQQREAAQLDAKQFAERLKHLQIEYDKAQQSASNAR